MRRFNTGDWVLVVNSVYNPGIIGHVGTVEHGEDRFTGHDRFGCRVSGLFVVVDLPGDRNRHGTTLWFLKPGHLVKLGPRHDLETSTPAELEATLSVRCSVITP